MRRPTSRLIVKSRDFLRNHRGSGAVRNGSSATMPQIPQVRALWMLEPDAAPPSRSRERRPRRRGVGCRAPGLSGAAGVAVAAEYTDPGLPPTAGTGRFGTPA